MNTNDFRQQLIDKFKKNSNQDESQEDIVHLTPQQAQKKFVKVADLIHKVNKKYRNNSKKRDKFDEKIAKIFKKFPDILIVQNELGKNLGMLAADAKLEQSVLVALDNYEASLQQDYWGFNTGMYTAVYRLEKPTLKALDNKEACKQKNVDGDTIENLYHHRVVPSVTHLIQN